ncbi:MAG: hypothetical protein AB1730_25365 [Myxococcota bacterium]|jgi:hypothetical protein
MTASSAFESQDDRRSVQRPLLRSHARAPESCVRHARVSARRPALVEPIVRLLRGGPMRPPVLASCLLLLACPGPALGVGASPAAR